MTAGKARSKVIEAYKGFVLSHRLEPYDPKRANEAIEHHATFDFYESDDGPLQLFVYRLAHDRVINLLEELFPDQIDASFSSQKLMESLNAWIQSGHEETDISSIELFASEFIETIASSIRDFTVYVPLYGIKLHDPRALDLGKCALLMNGYGSELRRLLDEKRDSLIVPEEMIKPIERAPAFLKSTVRAHFKRAIQNAKLHAELSCHILLLLIGSYYFDRHRNLLGARQFSIGASLLDGGDRVFYSLYEDDRTGETRLGGSLDFARHDLFEIDYNRIKIFKRLHLDRINVFMREGPHGDSSSIAKRIFLAITWFAKAASASSVSESFLCNAIALEALLSEGRTPQSTYASYIASLATRGTDDHLFPYPQPMSKEFANALHHSQTAAQRFESVRNRALELLRYRNRIAHGLEPHDGCDPVSQLDFEMLVRSAILSFIDGDWMDLAEFRKWENSNSRSMQPPSVYGFIRRLLGKSRKIDSTS